MRPLAHIALRVVAGVAALAIAHAAHAPAASAESCASPRQLGVVFVLDDSGSMAQSDAGALRATGAGAGLRELGAGSVAAAVSFSSDAQPIFAPTVLDSANVGPLTDLIAASLTSSGRTDFDPAFTEAKRQLDAMPASVDRKAVILLSDGEPNVGYDQDEPIAAAGIPIDTVGFGTGASAVLDGIAQRSGGKSVYVGTVAEAHGALARAVARLACKPVNEPESVTLVPGGSRDVPFDVPADTGSFTALAVWGQSDVRAKLIRPDGSAMGPRITLAGESFEEQASLVRATAAQPATGKWTVRLVADRANAESVRVTVELFGTPRLEHPLVTRPQPAGPGCETQIEVFGRVAWSSCFRAVAGGWRTTRPMRIAGLDIEPRGAGVLIRGSGRLKGTGRMFVTTSGPELGGGELTLADGELDIPLRGGRLLAPDLSKHAAASRIGGLRVAGNTGAELGWNPGGAQLKLALDLGPELEPLVPATSAVDPAIAGPALKPGFGMEVDLSTTNARGLAVERIEGRLDTSKLFGALPVRSLALAYDAQHNIWTGGAKVALLGNVLPSLDAELGVTVNLAAVRARQVRRERDQPSRRPVRLPAEAGRRADACAAAVHALGRGGPERWAGAPGPRHRRRIVARGRRVGLLLLSRSLEGIGRREATAPTRLGRRRGAEPHGGHRLRGRVDGA